MLKRGGTRLSSITQHTIWVECACGRAAPLVVADLLALPNPPETVADAVSRARCGSCGAHNVKEYRISYEGGSWGALRGAEQGRE
jgi:hypothetical protein